MATKIIYASGAAYTSANRSLSGLWGRDNHELGNIYGFALIQGQYDFNEYNNTTYLQFDLSNALSNRIVSVKLYLTRTSIISSTGGAVTTPLSVIATSFKAKSATDPLNVTRTITFNNAASLVEMLNKSVSLSDGTNSGVVVYDITSIVDAVNNQNGIIGITLNASGGRIINSNQYLEIETALIPPLAPTNLQPTGVRNPRGSIKFEWWHTAAETFIPDPQIGSELTVWQDGVTPKVFTITGVANLNTYTLPPNTFTEYKTVYYRVRTQSQHNGWGAYAQSSFQLGATPPLQSILIFPVNNTSVPGMNGVLLEWSYNSPTDTFPTRFDIRYNRDGEAWINLRNDSHGTNPAYQSAMTQAITSQDKITWQVKAFGELGDEGAWSELGTFSTIGVPDAPTIVDVRKTNRPTIYFAGENLMSWQLEILQNDKIIYETGNRLFTGEFQHQISDFLINGNYIARMRIVNIHGLTSEDATLPFTINTVAPQPLKLIIVSNPRFNIRLYFNNAGKTVYIYRSELFKNDFLRIGVTHGNMYDDFTARPNNPPRGVNTRYEYFVRVVNTDDSFADSNIVTGSLRFLETTIAEHIDPKNMLMLLKAIGDKPTKDEKFGFENTLTYFFGRESPVSQMGTHSSLSQSYSFFCTFDQYERLKQLKRSPYTLLLRDWRLGVVYGKINGDISSSPEKNGCNVSFSFTQTNFNKEVDLL